MAFHYAILKAGIIIYKGGSVMWKKLIGAVLVLCVLAAAVHFIPWPQSYDHTLKGVAMEYSVDDENIIS